MHGPTLIMLASLRLPNGRCCSLNCAATLLFLSSCSAAMADGETPAIAMPHFGFRVQDLKCVQLICRQMPALQVPLVPNTVVLLLAAALLLFCSYLHAELRATASCHARCIFCCVATPGRTIFRTISISMYLNPQLCSLADAAAAAYTSSLLLALL